MKASDYVYVCVQKAATAWPPRPSTPLRTTQDCSWNRPPSCGPRIYRRSSLFICATNHLGPLSNDLSFLRTKEKNTA